MSRLVTCNGCFDGLHPGHLFFLGYCAAQGDRLIVFVNDDDYIRKAKHREPYYTVYERCESLVALEFIDSAIVFSEDTPNKQIEFFHPQVHCTGEEYGINCPESSICKKLGIDLVFVPRIPFWSTSNNEKEGQQLVDCYMQRLLEKRRKLLGEGD